MACLPVIPSEGVLVQFSFIHIDIGTKRLYSKPDIDAIGNHYSKRVEV